MSERERGGERIWRTCFALYMFPLLLPTIIHRLSLEFISIWTVISSGELERDGWSRERSRKNERERERHAQTVSQRVLSSDRLTCNAHWEQREGQERINGCAR